MEKMIFRPNLGRVYRGFPEYSNFGPLQDEFLARFGDDQGIPHSPPVRFYSPQANRESDQHMLMSS